MTEVDVPTEIGYGKVVGRFVKFTADTLDVGDTPNEVPLFGSVLITPITQIMRWPTVAPPRLAVASSADCPVVDGDLYPPGSGGEGQPGVFLVATDQPEAQPTLIQWRATFRLAGVSTQPLPVVFNVPTGGVVDLAMLISVPPEPPAIIVVSAETAAEAAASAASAAVDAAAADADRVAAEAAASAADASKTAASGSATAASGSATAAAGSATAALSAKTGAETAQTGAQAAKTGAETAQTAAAGSATAAAGSATAASGSATAASNSAAVLAAGKAVLVLSSTAPVPGGTPVGTVILRTAT
jgi:hypothetical protein